MIDPKLIGLLHILGKTTAPLLAHIFEYYEDLEYFRSVTNYLAVSE